MARLHDGPPADPLETIVHFWIGSLYARYGTDEQLDDWYRLTHGWPRDE